MALTVAQVAALPDLGLPALKAKIDTGARSSAIHAFDLEAYEQDGMEWVRFSIHPWQRSDEDHVELSLPVLDRREVRSSNGQVEQRYAVSLDVRLAGRTITTVMTLSNRNVQQEYYLTDLVAMAVADCASAPIA